MEPIEQRRDYPDLLTKIEQIRYEQQQQMELLKKHIQETQEIHDLWSHSRWLMQFLKLVAVSAATFVAGWLAIKQLLGGPS